MGWWGGGGEVRHMYMVKMFLQLSIIVLGIPTNYKFIGANMPTINTNW